MHYTRAEAGNGENKKTDLAGVRCAQAQPEDRADRMEAVKARHLARLKKNLNFSTGKLSRAEHGFEPLLRTGPSHTGCSKEQPDIEKRKGVEMVAIDPVCKMTVDEKKAAATYDYKGKTYYFCATGCRDAFSKDPDKFLKKEKQ